MNIEIIEEAIKNIEATEDLTSDEVILLSALYIVKTNLQKTSSIHENYSTEMGIKEFPYYQKYKDIKRKYQLKQTTEGEVIKGMKNTCRELKEFVKTMYYNTDMNKERLCLKAVLIELVEELCS